MGVELKAFHIQDGHGMKMAARGGLHVGWISSRFSHVTSRRTRELGIRLVSQPDPEQKPPPPKLKVAEQMAAELGIGLDRVCFRGRRLGGRTRDERRRPAGGGGQCRAGD